ncbi:hypothetical protein LguiA_003809 [Lonicera macranthoides]
MSVSGGDDSTRNSSVQDCQTRIAQKQSSTLAENEENLPIDLIYQHDGKISHQLANKSVLRTVQKSFQSTLMNLGLINESSQNHAEEQFRRLNNENCCQEGDSTCNSGLQDCQSEAIKNNMSNWDPPSFCEENMPTDLTNYELALHDEQINRQLVSVSPNELHSAINKNVLTTLQKSVMEQARSNDLKTYEIGLTLRKLKLKETQLSLNSDSNFLERCKLSMGISRASFRAEKFKNQLEDARHSELLKKCIDCLVAGLLIMLACLAYGAYVYSRQRITEATAACTPTKESKSSWWIPNPMASFNSGIHVLMCQVQVGSRMLFGGLMILSITYLLLQRASTSNQTMPVTFILLLLGITCGFAGKLCVDALGGSGYHWLVYWEALCSLHLFSNICISTLFVILHGPIVVSENSKRRTIFPYWIRRFLFYATALLFLPLLCGFSPFAGPGEWKDHFSSLVIGGLLPFAGLMSGKVTSLHWSLIFYQLGFIECCVSSEGCSDIIEGKAKRLGLKKKREINFSNDEIFTDRRTHTQVKLCIDQREDSIANIRALTLYIIQSMRKKATNKRKRNLKEEKEASNHKNPSNSSIEDAAASNKDKAVVVTKTKRTKTSKPVSEPEFFEEKRNLVFYLC